MSSSKPTYIYKIWDGSANIPLDVPSLPESLDLPSLDRNSGFIYLSTAPQVPNTLKHFFSAHEKVFLIRILFERVERDIRWEDPEAKICGNRDGEGMFPHLYNGLRLGRNEIDSIRVLKKEKGGTWDEALESAKEWMVY